MQKEVIFVTILRMSGFHVPEGKIVGGDQRGHVIRHLFPGLVHFSYSLVNMECLQAWRQRSEYFITFSRADVVKFPSKESFFPMLYYKLGRTLALEFYSR